MFGKTERKIDQGRPTVPSLFSAGLVIEGSAITEGDIEIAATLKGNISCRKLTLGPDGTIIGEIKAETAILHGKVNGTVDATTVEIASTGHIKGDVTHSSIAIEAGAHIEGKLQRRDNNSLSLTEERHPLVLTPSLETA